MQTCQVDKSFNGFFYKFNNIDKRIIYYLYPKKTFISIPSSFMMYNQQSEHEVI